MSRKQTSQNNSSKKTKNERGSIPWRYRLLIFVCGLFLVGGFFVAARQHFSSIDYSIKNSRLRKQIEELEADKRRFLLAKEVALTPSEIKKAAKKLGLTEMTASNIEVYRAVSDMSTGSQADKSVDIKLKPPIVNKSSDVKPAERKPEKDEKKPKDAASGKEKSSVKKAK